jgi:hypothetical protein
MFAKNLSDVGCIVIEVIGHGEPTVRDVEDAMTKGREARVEVVVAVGGGAVIDLGKAVAALIPADGHIMDHLEGVGAGQPLLRDPLPFVALPTTAGTGAEVTKNAVIGVPEAGRKVSLRDDRMIPRLAIIDPTLTDHTPQGITVASGLDAITQVIEPYLSLRANPLTDAICRAAIPMGLEALHRLTLSEDREARDAMAYVSLAGGIALANAGLGAVHGLAGVIGGSFAAPHGLICGRLLAPVLCRNQDAAIKAGSSLDRYTEIATWIEKALGVPRSSAFEGLSAWIDDLGVPRLGQWIGPASDLNLIAEDAAKASSTRANPFVLSQLDLAHSVSEAL